MKEVKHDYAATQPGHQILRQSATLVMAEDFKEEDYRFFIANLTARQDEFIPDEYKDELINLVLTAAASLAGFAEIASMPPPAAIFLDKQIGREKLSNLLSETNQWVIRDCDCCSSPGYHIVATDPDRVDRARRKKEEIFLQSIFGEIFGPRGRPGSVVVEVIGLR
jgi:hypothetical protein